MTEIGTILSLYESLEKKYNAESESLKRKEDFVSVLRLCAVLGCVFGVYLLIKSWSVWVIFSIFILLLAFLSLIRYHDKLGRQKAIKIALATVNKTEKAYLTSTYFTYDSGLEFLDYEHAYAYDLDLFGSSSLFHHLNRTNTFGGKQQLADMMLKSLTCPDILTTQDAIKELSSNLDFRQKLIAYASLTKDNKNSVEQWLNWLKKPSGSISKTLILLSYILPSAMTSSIIYLIISGDGAFFGLVSTMFSLQIILVFSKYNEIKNEIISGDGIPKIIENYGFLTQLIEQETFKSITLDNLKNKLFVQHKAASIHLKELAAIQADMDNIQNLMGAILSNGFLMFHLHTLRKLYAWKKENTSFMLSWVETIGTFEAYCSLANLAYNNPAFIYPLLNNSREISLKAVGHPLINRNKRIVNDITFDQMRFVILTGSNMSGKSTYLRTLGVNMILTGMGAPLCASEANIHPMPVLVSMRHSDSLNKDESYFYAEVKRLKMIMDRLEKGLHFVILDEILRGTNSDDKRSGSIEVIKKLMTKGAYGIIATHDIEVCQTKDLYPNEMENMCFEGDIVENDLFFDYKLRLGICKNKSATFLMKKIGVI